MKKKTTKNTQKARSSAAHGSAHSLAATIAAALFTSGDGKRASRLHFILESGDVWGGWRLQARVQLPSGTWLGEVAALTVYKPFS